MDSPPELAFGQLLVGGISFMLLSAALLVMFIVVYQKRLLQQQLLLRATEAEYQQQLLAAVIEAQEHERERIGRDLHDGIGSTLATAKLLVGRLENTTSEEATNLTIMVKEILGNAVHDVRGLSHSLYPAVLDRFGLAEALQHLADVCNETSTLDVELSIDYQQPLILPQELALYRICQELIHNAQKHAQGATLLQVQLSQHSAGVRLSVADDGCGFDTVALAETRPASGGAGLRSIEVRVQMLRARLSQESAPGRGTRTLIELDQPSFA
jgi:two-component system NarL family sensor kinase